MGREIERKFLVKGEYKSYAVDSHHIIQGYLSSVSERTVRVRIQDNIGYLTIKGVATAGGFSRFEWEKEISLSDARELLELCEPGIIEKTRYLIKEGAHIFEVDEFYGDNQGLVVAEVELQNEHDVISIPHWLGTEVTGDDRYFNSMLKKNPYKNWK